MNRGQRIVLVIAWAWVVTVGASLVTSSLQEPSFGWFNYSPNPTPSQSLLAAHSFGGAPDAVSAVVWLFAIGIWTAGALWLLRSPASDTSR